MPVRDPYGEPTRADVPVADPTAAMPASTGAEPPVGPPPTELPPDEPPYEPPDRRPWILGGLLALIVLVGLAVLLLGGDDDDEQTTGTTTTSTTVEDTTTTTEAATTTAPPTTTTTAPSSTTEAPPTTVDPARCVSSSAEDPGPTALVVYEAYTLGDRSCAGNLATSDAINQLFSIPGGGGGWSFEDCFESEEEPETMLCGFTFNSGSTTFKMHYSETEGWTVFNVFQTAS